MVEKYTVEARIRRSVSVKENDCVRLDKRANMEDVDLRTYAYYGKGCKKSNDTCIIA